MTGLSSSLTPFQELMHVDGFSSREDYQTEREDIATRGYFWMCCHWEITQYLITILAEAASLQV